MLPPPMLRARRRPAAILALLALAGTLASCGGTEHGLEVAEGEPVELGELTYNVQLTRFLNPNDIEDAEYLVGQPPAGPGNSYLGVFLRIANESDEEHPSAEHYELTDIRGDRYEPVETDSPFALSIGTTARPDGQLPPVNSTAATGPAAGALLLFRVDDAVIDRRPVRLEIATEDGTAEIELDI
jgi:hypothetical protein